MKPTIVLLCSAMLLCTCVRADPQSEASALKDSSMKILKDTADRDATPDEMAKCIFNLEKASGILEAAKDNDSDLAKEVNSALYWARKRSTLAVDAALDKLHGRPGGYKPPPMKKAAVAVAKADPNDPADPGAGSAEAKAAFNDAERFARAHSDDQYMVALNWFQMASLHPGTDYSLKALTLARDARARFTAANAEVTGAKKADEAPETAEMRPVKEGDVLLANREFPRAVTEFQASIKIKDNALAHRKLGQVYYEQAQVIKQEVIEKCSTAYEEWKSARDAAYVNRMTLGGGMRRVFNQYDPRYVEASKVYRAAFAEGNKAFELYDKAQTEFKAAIKLSPNGKDLISAGTMGICMSQRPDFSFRSKARVYLASFLKEYAPVNDDERAVYEYCKTELERISK